MRKTIFNFPSRSRYIIACSSVPRAFFARCFFMKRVISSPPPHLRLEPSTATSAKYKTEKQLKTPLYDMNIQVDIIVFSSRTHSPHSTTAHQRFISTRIAHDGGKNIIRLRFECPTRDSVVRVWPSLRYNDIMHFYYTSRSSSSITADDLLFMVRLYIAYYIIGGRYPS